jgi:hypothetical protein
LVLAAVIGFGVTACGTDSNPTLFAALCRRGRPDGHVDVEYTQARRRDARSSEEALGFRVIRMYRSCCPNLTPAEQRDGMKHCPQFATFGDPVRGSAAFPVDLGRRATGDDRDVVVAFLRRYGTAHAT